MNLTKVTNFTREVTLLRKMCTQLWKFLVCTRYAAISLFFIAQRAVKAWIIENCVEKMTFGQDNTNFIDLMCFIDFLSKIFHQKIRKNLVFKFKKKVLFETFQFFLHLFVDASD